MRNKSCFTPRTLLRTCQRTAAPAQRLVQFPKFHTFKNRRLVFGRSFVAWGSQVVACSRGRKRANFLSSPPEEHTLVFKKLSSRPRSAVPQSAVPRSFQGTHHHNPTLSCRLLGNESSLRSVPCNWCVFRSMHDGEKWNEEVFS